MTDEVVLSHRHPAGSLKLKPVTEPVPNLRKGSFAAAAWGSLPPLIGRFVAADRDLTDGDVLILMLQEVTELLFSETSLVLHELPEGLRAVLLLCLLSVGRVRHLPLVDPAMGLGPRQAPSRRGGSDPVQPERR